MKDWQQHPMFVVTGCIDSYGAIRAEASAMLRNHTDYECRGRRFRWFIHFQKFMNMGPSADLTAEETEHVLEWLRRRGYAEDNTPPPVA